jgi:hypothetical protein
MLFIYILLNYLKPLNINRIINIDPDLLINKENIKVLEESPEENF